MAIRFFKAATPGTRHGSVLDFSEVTTKKPEKSLTTWWSRSKGRNNRGIITSRHRGGGHKRLYREIDFGRTKVNIPAKVTHIEYDPNRNSRIALVNYQDGEKRYILHPVGLQVGDTVVASPEATIAIGNCLPLVKIPLGNCSADCCKRRHMGYSSSSFGRSSFSFTKLLGNNWSCWKC